MRRRVTLYIAEQAADLSDDALVLLNIQREDLYNPAVVLNSYSQAVTLPGTKNNDIIFGHYFRADHSVAGGFNPLVRVPFSIFADTGEVLVAGYCKLLNVTTQKGAHTYEVQLYGSLGEFIYGLAYDADGKKKSLASLDYLGGGDTELDFVIDKTAVADAWARLGGDTSKPAMWDVVNFAPAYNGIPSGDFDASKALAGADGLGITIPTGYTASTGGYILVEFPQEVDEWAAHDLRSYLQRPVLSVKALLEAIAKPENNGGWTIDLSDIDTAGEWPYLRTWLTRPLLPSLGTFKQTTGSITATPSSSATSGPDIVSIALANVPSGAEVTLRASFTLQVNLASAPGLSTMQTRRLNYGNEYQSVWFIQLVGYASDNSVVAASPVTIFGPTLSFISDLAQFAEDCTFTPTLPTGQEAQYVAASGIDQSSLAGSGTAFSSRGAFSLETTGKNMASAKVIVKRGTILWNQFSGRVYSVQNLSTLYTDTAPTATAYAESTSQATGISVTASMQSASTLRSGARVTKQMLLSTEGTPADYLLAICKSFGLYILADGATKTASIVRRSTLYENETIDLTERVDTSQEVELQPLAIESKYYVWKHDDVGAAFGKEYKENTGRDYGAQRVNTGYDFDAKERNVLDGVVLKGTAAVKASGPFWNYIIDAGHMKPSPFLLPGNKFTSWDGSGNSIDTAIPSVGSGASVTQYAGGYDINERAQFTGKDGKPVDGADVLLFAENYFGNTDFPHFEGFYLTDDVADMDTLVGKPCWMLQGSVPLSGVSATNVVIPTGIPLKAGVTYNIWFKSDTLVSPAHANIGLWIEVNGSFTRIRTYTPAELYAGYTYTYTPSDDCLLWVRTIQIGVTWHVLVTPPSGGVDIPHFSRYVLRTIFPDPLLPGETSVWRALDFGIPAEVDIPNIAYNRGTIYEQAWKQYVADRLDKDTKVLRCRVRLDGLQVGQGLLRKFYWYRGSLWALNKITNYSLTTYDPAECEFIQVQDIDNYV